MHTQLRLFTQQLFLDFRAIFFPDWPLIFLVITIHQVIWPSPGTLAQGTIFGVHYHRRFVGVSL